MSEGLIIETKGRWADFEYITNTKFEQGKTYKIKVEGVCQFAISPTKPSVGISTNELSYTNDGLNKLWILTK